MKAVDIEPGKEYGIRGFRGIEKAVVKGVGPDPRWQRDGKKVALLDREISYRIHAPLSAVIGPWNEHPEWQSRLDAAAESKRLADELRRLLPAAVSIGNFHGAVSVELRNAEAEALIAILKGAAK
jgi:hypothetical protein